LPTSRSANDRSEWRVFCAIELPTNLRERIRLHITNLRSAHPKVSASWSHAENAHLTIKFFGNVAQSRINGICAAADRAVANSSPFNIVIGGSGVFPGASRARVLWIGVANPDAKLIQLHNRFENECVQEGFEKETREFRPHLTVARVRRPEGSRPLAETHLKNEFADVIVPVNELVVFRSELSSSGSKYTVLSRHALNVR